MQRYKIICLLAALCLMLGCSHSPGHGVKMEYASFFYITEDGRPVVVSPFNGHEVTLEKDVKRIVCMSSSHVGYLDAIGASDVIVGVSGLSFLLNPDRGVEEVGYDPALDYETIYSLHPDLLLTFMVSSSEPASFEKLRELGIPVVVVSEHLEDHPLARAEYLKFFGALTGHTHEADSVFSLVKERYNSMTKEEKSCKVLMNIPYADQWFIPGGDNYMAKLISDAGGEILGSKPGSRKSTVIGIEKAWEYGRQADFWIGTGSCRSLKELRRANPLFHEFPVIEKQVWNTGAGFWETGPVRPDLVLEDLINIFTHNTAPNKYYIRLE